MLKIGDFTSVTAKKEVFRKWYRDFFVYLQQNSKIMDYKTTLIGRRHEQDLIREYYESPKTELVAVYGRRRVGKTFLIKQCFDETFDFYFTGSFEVPGSRCCHTPSSSL